jgi:hypothetical protein
VAEAPQIGMVPGSLGGLANGQRMLDLSINHRDYGDLRFLQLEVLYALSVQQQRLRGCELRNFLRGPALRYLILAKDTSAHAQGERGKVKFRAEFFNLFSHPNLPIAGARSPANVVECHAGRATVRNPLASAGTIASRMELRARFNLPEDHVLTALQQLLVHGGTNE